MAQPFDPDDGQEDSSDGLDMVTLYTGPLISEPEADVIRGVLETNGIPSIMIRPTGYPSLGVEIRVPQARLADAEKAIADQRAAGPEAAAEAEAASEEG